MITFLVSLCVVNGFVEDSVATVVESREFINKVETDSNNVVKLLAELLCELLVVSISISESEISSREGSVDLSGVSGGVTVDVNVDNMDVVDFTCDDIALVDGIEDDITSDVVSDVTFVVINVDGVSDDGESVVVIV